VSGTTYCDDDVTMNDECRATNSCEACTTFNQADIDHIKGELVMPAVPP
jgi:hypothetical protein